MTEYFIRGTEPMEVDTMHQILSLDRRNGLLAGEECDPKFIQKEKMPEIMYKKNHSDAFAIIQYPSNIKKFYTKNIHPK